MIFIYINNDFRPHTRAPFVSNKYCYCLDTVKKDQMEPLKSLQTERKQNDDVVQDKGNATKLPKSNDFESLLDEQEKFYKTEITKKDDDILHLMTENEKIQQQVQDLKQKSEEG